ncbi:hypothetical protein GCM10027404_08640 [Arthrobacter tumbae]
MGSTEGVGVADGVEEALEAGVPEEVEEALGPGVPEEDGDDPGDAGDTGAPSGEGALHPASSATATAHTEP